MANKAITKWMTKLGEMEGAVNERRNVHETVLKTGSPSADFTFGGGHGIPCGYTLALFGEPKAGKSVMLNSIIGQMHKTDPDAVAIKFNTEFREEAQLSDDMQRVYGIDPGRIKAFNRNQPGEIFDFINKDIAAMAQEVKIGIIAIDSINQIVGRRESNQDTMMTQNIADLAQTLKVGFKAILPMQRKNRITFIITAHVTAELDPVKQMQGGTVKMSAGFGVQHYAEYAMFVSKVNSKAGRQNLLGEDLIDESKTDLMGKGDLTGHRIRVKMHASSMGPAGRVGEFTLDYHRGIVNVEEEVFQLGFNRGIIVREGNSRYGVDGTFWNGKAAILKALRENDELQKTILNRLRDADLRGDFNALSEEELNTVKPVEG